MPAFAAITAAYDVTTASKNISGADDATPQAPYLQTGGVTADKTLSPERINSEGLARWVDRSGGYAIGYPSYTQRVRPPTRGSRIFRVTSMLSIPTLEEVTAATASGVVPAPARAYDLGAKLEFFLPERSANIERRALLSMLRSLLIAEVRDNANANPVSTASPLAAAVLDFDGVY